MGNVIHGVDCMPSHHLSQQSDLIAVSQDSVDPSAVVAAVSAPEAGAVVLFVGTVRDQSPGRTGVTHLEYESYDEQVIDKIAEVVAEVRERWPVRKVAAIHRIGELGVGEISIAVAVSSPHRSDAFEAGRYLIDEVKARAPIWKKEHWPGGAEWVREDLHHS
jgi:molybdopterin synthase catalytic subunit